MKVNYQLICDREIDELTKDGRTPRLLLHSCCGPCSSYVLEYLSQYFEITVLFFNPNIYPAEEYEKRLNAQEKIISEMNFKNPVSLMTLPYGYNEFLCAAKGNENEREGGARCTECFKLRIGRTALEAKRLDFDCFTTTLSVSPHKNAALINKIGEEFSQETGVKFLTADFKKREGYKRSIELSKQYDLYRQDYCGCEFSIPEKEEIVR